MLHEAVTPTGVFFWLLFVVLSGFIFATMPLKKNLPIGYGIVATFAVVLVLGLFGPRDWAETVMHDPLKALAYFGGYVAIGVAFGCWKWDALLLKRRNKLAEEERDWMHENAPERGEKVPDDLIPAFRTHLLHDPYWTYRKPAPLSVSDLLFGGGYSRNEGAPTLRIIPRPWHYKSQWMAWSIWWPWSATYYVFVELLWNIFQTIWQTVSGWMDRWGRYRFRDYQRFE